jgi:hypothetical protein
VEFLVPFFASVFCLGSGRQFLVVLAIDLGLFGSGFRFGLFPKFVPLFFCLWFVRGAYIDSDTSSGCSKLVFEFGLRLAISLVLV